ncbi:MAG: zinc-binding alcohol dehydrogenase [Deltaproteobacteria bacterium]|jgi:2-desacetyl-2-hydroxyethyl bacteriochlorophyllide A dehydrogenase
MKRTSVIFEKPYAVVLQTESFGEPAAGEVLVKTKFSAISPGSELLVYRGEFPPRLPVDGEIKALSEPFQYPIKYGYISVGEVVAVSSAVSKAWRDRPVFCFHPHESHYVASLNDIIPIPEGIDPVEALFLPNTETAVNFIMDGRPVIGERAVIFGQGVVGLLTTALLAKFPLDKLVTLDRYEIRRRASMVMGAHDSLDPESASLESDLAELLKTDSAKGAADLIYELSGNPEALNQAVAIAGFGARVVIGSWYGTKQARLNLGGQFHRSRIRLISSQVSSIAPEFSGRWTKNRRMETAWEMIRKIRPAQFITHQFPVRRIREAYELLDKTPQKAIQVVITYED